MISCILRGQLGNQMFQVATTVAHAIRCGQSCVFPSRSGKRGQFAFAFPHLPTYHDMWTLPEVYVEPKFGEYQPIPVSSHDQLLKGYFQSELYFKDQRQAVINSFKLDDWISRPPWLADTVSIHVRRGDYLKLSHKYKQMTDTYLEEAILAVGRDWRFLVFSDEPDWCFEKFRNRKNFMIFRNQDPKVAMIAMSKCQHHIIANSTFSWWGAWLNESPSKMVVSPDHDSWFTQAYADRLSTKDLIPDGWIKLKF